MSARHRVARRYHRSILQPETNASARDGLVRQTAKATTLDHFRSSARGQVRQLLQDRLQLGVTGCGGGRVLRRQLTDGRAKLSAAGLGGSKACNGALADHAALLLGERGVDVQGAPVDVAPQRDDNERN